MAAVAVDRPGVRPPRPAGPPGFKALLRSERTKLTSLRSTWWSLTAMIVLSLGSTLIVTAVMTSRWHGLDEGAQAQYRDDTIGMVLQPGAQWAQVAACVLGVLLMASEFSTGMIRSTMLAVPRRTPVLVAKAVVFGAALFVVAQLIAVPSVLIGATLTNDHASLSLADATTLRALLAFGVYIALTGVIAVSIGALVRHPAGAISLVLGLQFILPGVLGVLPLDTGKYLSGALPLNTSVMMSTGANPALVYTPLQGFLIMLAWTALLVVAAGLSLKKRDV
ncbi:ABC transporter permease [Streptomyces sp. NPDC127068]|uniref:ABC transporter permease n=1 Tax=Streptomyces sp. NPDC127068 TaxID=3347127 RepID=UPI00364E5B64